MCASVSSPGKLKSTSKRQMSASMCQKRFYVIWKIMKTFLPFTQCMGCISSCTIDWIPSLRHMNTLSICTFFFSNAKMCTINIRSFAFDKIQRIFLLNSLKALCFLLEFTHFTQWMSKCDLDFIDHWNAWKMVSIQNYCCGI